MTMTKPIRVILSKVGLDGHDVGVRVVASGFRDAGMEVIYLGLRQSPEKIVKAAIEEDADVIGVSILSGAHLTFIPKIIKLLQDDSRDDIPVICGGVIPDEDVEPLLREGVKAVFRSGSNVSEMVDFVKKIVSSRTYS